MCKSSRNIIKLDCGTTKSPQPRTAVSPMPVQSGPLDTHSDVESNPIGAALDMISEHFLADWFNSYDLISKILTGLARIAPEIYQHDEDREKLFFEYYFKHFSAYEEILKHSRFQCIREQITENWFGPKRPSPFLQIMNEEDMSFVLVELFQSWKRSVGANDLELIEQLAIQKVAIAAATATPGGERDFLDDDYRVTRIHMEYDLNYEEISKIRRNYFMDNR